MRLKSVLLAGGLSLFSARSAEATVVLKKSIDELAVIAPIIVRGTVRQSQVVQDRESSRFFTLTEVTVDEIVKGKPRSTVVVRQPGGTMGELTETVSGAATFTEGEQVVLFLEPAVDDPSVHVVLTMAAGKVKLQKNKLGELRAVRKLDGLAFYDPSEKGTVPFHVLDAEDLGSAKEFVARIRRSARGPKVKP